MDTDAVNNKISNTSPVGKTLMGHKVGDEVEVKTPSGTMRLRIIEVS